MTKTCDSRNGRLLKKKKKEKQNKTRKEGKKNLLSGSSTLIRFSCEVLFACVYAHFLRSSPHPPPSSVFFISSLVCTDQNRVAAFGPMGREEGGCYGDVEGGACARRSSNLLRLTVGGTSPSPPSTQTYEATNARICHVTTSVARRGGRAQKQKLYRPFSGRAVSSAKGFTARHLSRTPQIQNHPPIGIKKKSKGEKTSVKKSKKQIFLYRTDIFRACIFL